MITKFEKYNESIRDKMTPKSKEEIEEAYINLIKSIDNPVNTMAPEWQAEFQKLADIINVPVTDLHIIDEDKLDYPLLDEFFSDLVVDAIRKVEVEIPEDGDFAGGTYTCYPRQKLIYWSSNIHDDLHVWIFSKSHFTKINESIRDMMTPKSKEEILNNLKGDRSVVFKPSNEDIDDDWTSKTGVLDASYSDLVKLFGEPNAEVDNYKSTTAWQLKDNKGRFVFINDYKSTNLYDNDADLPTLEEFKKLPSYDWSISGGRRDQKSLVNDLITFVILNTM